MGGLPFGERVPFGALVSRRERFEGVEIPPGSLPRLAAACLSILGPAKARVAFGRDLQGLGTISGQVSCEVELSCERCGNPLRETLCCEFCSTPDRELAHSLRLEDRLDLIELGPDGTLAILDYLEDCLLLELPVVARHAEGDPACEVPEGLMVDPLAEGEGRPESPFSALRGQLPGDRG
ncbi:MAG: YceD family protein [Succinivibrionaceae bacterium]|nr:YceD family protein [Succinivibrionaceae bacterium]